VRFLFLAGVLSILTLSSQMGWSLPGGKVRRGDRRGDRRELSSATDYNCQLEHPDFCITATECEIPSEYAFTCCKNNETDCITYHNDTCGYDWLCEAELVPGHGNGAAECLKNWEKNGGAWAYVFLLLFLFLGLAIVCDDYFVASLEKISEGLGLSEDVAGATFMAAGSSAPELFVSLADNVIANPPKSVGIGTIVGSAIFNILVIIGLSALLAGQTLFLDWRPLARDIFFYIASIVALVGVVYDKKVEWWEALILLLMYVSYIVFMAYNQRFFLWLDRKLGITREEEKTQMSGSTPVDDSIDENHVSFADLDAQEDRPRAGSSEAVVKAAEAVLDGAPSEANSIGGENNVRHTVETSRPTAAVEAAAETIMRERHDSDPALFNDDEPGKTHPHGGNPLHSSKNRAAWKTLSKRGSMRFKEKPHLQNVARAVIRANNNNTLKTWQSTVEDGGDTRRSEGTNSLVASTSVHIDTGDDLVNKSQEEEEEEEEGYWDCLKWPLAEDCDGFQSCCGGWRSTGLARIWYIISFPHNLLYRFTIPDCNYDVFCEDKPGKKENRRIGYWLCFVMCIVWIAILSHFLVFSAAKFGCIVGISPAVMGLTFIAAGTSVPDAISSIIVARQGQGDMAVANSIGSNVFDILMGLGLPWLIASGFVYKVPSVVQTGDLWVGLGFLFGVVAFLLAALAYTGWQLGKRVGCLLIFLYVLYIIFELFIHCKIKEPATC